MKNNNVFCDFFAVFLLMLISASIVNISYNCNIYACNVFMTDPNMMGVAILGGVYISVSNNVTKSFRILPFTLVTCSVMLKRPKHTEREEDLLSLQETFFKSKEHCSTKISKTERKDVDAGRPGTKDVVSLQGSTGSGSGAGTSYGSVGFNIRQHMPGVSSNCSFTTMNIIIILAAETF